MIPTISKSARKLLCDSCRARFPVKTPSLFAKQLVKQRKEKQEQERLTKKEETAAIREAVFKRAAGRCEICELFRPEEMHHLESGTGRRLQQQAVNNCMAICSFCHRLYHANPDTYLPRIMIWTATHGYPVPSRFRRPKADARNEPSNALAIASARESR